MFVGKLYDVLYEETVRGKPCRERKVNENRVKLLKNENENENESKNENELLVIIDLNKESKAINGEEKEDKEGIEEKINRSNSKIPFYENENVIESDIDVEVEQCSDDEVRTFSMCVRSIEKSKACKNLKRIYKFKYFLIILTFFINSSLKK